MVRMRTVLTSNCSDKSCQSTARNKNEAENINRGFHVTVKKSTTNPNISATLRLAAAVQVFESVLNW